MRVLISTSSIGGAARARLQGAGCEVRLNPHGRRLTAEEVSELLVDVEGLLAGTEPLDAALFSRHSQLRVISRCGVGMDNVDQEAAGQLGIRVFNTPDSHVDAVAELCLAGLLTLLRRVAKADRDLRAGTWKKPMGSLLRNRSVGFVGFGKVARRFSELLAPFEIEALAWDAFPSEAWASRVRFVELDELLSSADIVSLHLPGSPDLVGLLGADRLGKMKQGAVLLNTARGDLLDEQALVELLQRGHLGGAYLDVFAAEPYSGPLLSLDNVVLTPHIGSYAAEARERMELQAVEHLLRGLSESGSR